jgi:hypothetical protein
MKKKDAIFCLRRAWEGFRNDKGEMSNADVMNWKYLLNIPLLKS